LEFAENLEGGCRLALAIRTDGLTKYFENPTTGGLVTAVSNLSIEVEEGEIFGFLGPNGAGKTTTIKMLLGLIFPSRGTAEVLGRPAGDIEAKRLISYLPESPYFYEHMTASEVLDFYGRIFHLGSKERRKRTEELVNTVGLAAAGRKRLGQYSKGMLQRIGIAQALVNDPELLFFDEPTSGLDPIAHIEIRDLIRSIGRQGKTMFLSSHQLYDVEMVCDRVAIIYDGLLRRVGRLDELLTGDEVDIKASNLDAEAEAKLRQGATHFAKENGAVRVRCQNTKSQDLIDLIRRSKGVIESVGPHRKTMEEVFVETVEQAVGG
jgi:ABC-2 type transport system ATP-binding protein